MLHIIYAGEFFLHFVGADIFLYNIVATDAGRKATKASKVKQ